MNNNKLFKLALVLCVSVLIIVSCGKKNLLSKQNVPTSPSSTKKEASSTQELTTVESSSTTELSSDASPPIEVFSTTPSNTGVNSMGALSVKSYGTILNLHNDDYISTSKSATITVSGFSESFRKAVQNKTDVKYTIKQITVTSVTSKDTTTEQVLRSIKNNALIIVNSSKGKFDEIQIGLSGSKIEAEQNARDIASAINTGRSAYITLLVEASPAGNTAGKFSSSTFELRFIIQVLV